MSFQERKVISIRYCVKMGMYLKQVKICEQGKRLRVTCTSNKKCLMGRQLRIWFIEHLCSCFCSQAPDDAENDDDLHRLPTLQHSLTLDGFRGEQDLPYNGPPFPPVHPPVSVQQTGGVLEADSRQVEALQDRAMEWLGYFEIYIQWGYLAFFK